MPAPVLEVVTSSSSSAAPTSVAKALTLLGVFRAAGPVLGVSELARRTGVPKQTASRLVSQLAAADLVEKCPGGYRLSWRLFELASHVPELGPTGLRETASPWMGEALARLDGCAVHLGVLVDDDVLCVDKVTGSRSPRLASTVGGRLPANCTALGKVLFAHQPQERQAFLLSRPLSRRTRQSIAAPRVLLDQLHRARSTGVATDLGEYNPGVTCIAAPITVGGRVVAAVSISGSANRVLTRSCEDLVRTTSRCISQDLESYLGDAAADA